MRWKSVCLFVFPLILELPEPSIDCQAWPRMSYCMTDREGHPFSTHAWGGVWLMRTLARLNLSFGTNATQIFIRIIKITWFQVIWKTDSCAGHLFSKPTRWSLRCISICTNQRLNFGKIDWLKVTDQNDHAEIVALLMIRIYVDFTKLLYITLK